MFILKLYDRLGTELKEGDFVKVSNGKSMTFFAEVKYIESEGIITPFHTFSFHSFEKVDKLPDNAIKCDEDRYEIYYMNNEEEDNNASDYQNYLLTWKECEYHIEKRSWSIAKS